MKWEKLGCIFNANGRSEWMHGYAYLPTAMQLDAGRIRVYLAFRDKSDVGRIGWIDVAPSDPRTILDISARPALDIGPPGAFDDNGVSPMCVLRDGDQLRLYYAGWQLTPRVRYILLTGVAFSDDGGDSFERYGNVPVLERSNEAFIVRSGTYVMQDGPIWRLWYAAGSQTIEIHGRQVPTYQLNYAASDDGLSWPEKGTLSIMPKPPDEFGFGRPAVWKHDGHFHIIYSVRLRSRGYRLGYATSENGISWVRDDRSIGLDVSSEGWDSEIVAFASIVKNEYGCFMFYNGNGNGRTGVGVARLIEP